MKSKNALILIMVIFSISIQAQSIVLVAPDTGTQCEVLTLNVTGENTHFSQGTSTIQLQKSGSSNIHPWGISVQNDTMISGTFYFNPSNDPGSYSVRTYDASGEIILQDGFYLHQVDNEPEIQSINPVSGQTGDDITMDIKGSHTHFNQGVNQRAWLYCSEHGQTIQSTSLETVNDSLMQMGFNISSYATPGNYTLYVHTQLDAELSLSNGFTIGASAFSPELISVVPNKAYQGSELTVTVTGKNTYFEQGTSSLFLSTFGYSPIYPTNQTVINDTIIEGDFIFNYAQSLGYYNVVSTKYGEGSIVMTDGFQLLSGGAIPYIDTLFPPTAQQGKEVILTIKTINSHFEVTSNTPSVTLKNGQEELYCHDVIVVDSVTIEARYIFSFSNSLGIYDLSVYTPFEGALHLESCFELQEATSPASIVSVSPDSALLGQALTIHVTGRDIIFMQGTSNLMLSQNNLTITPTFQTIVNDTMISGEFDFHTTFPEGLYDVKVDNGPAWPSVTLPDGFSLKLFDFIHENNTTLIVSVYPNPAKKFLYVAINQPTKKKITIQIFDFHGQSVLKNEMPYDSTIQQIQLSDLRPGTYLIEFTYNGNKQSEKLIIN